MKSRQVIGDILLLIVFTVGIVYAKTGYESSLLGMVAFIAFRMNKIS